MRKILTVILLCCFVFSSACADVYSELETGVVSVVAPGTLPLRQEPRLSAEISLHIASGVAMTLLQLDEESGWAYVRIDFGPKDEPALGYVRSGGLMNGDYLYWDMCRVVNPEEDERLNLRSLPQADAASLGKYYTGVLVQNYHQETDGYLRVRVGDQVGFMDKDYLVPWDSTDISRLPVTTIANPQGTGGNLRKKPSVSSKRIALWPNGTKVVVLGVVPGGWCHVMIGGKTGFMQSRLLAEPFSFAPPTQQPEIK